MIKNHIKVLCLLTGILISQTIHAQSLFQQVQQIKQSDRFEQTKQEIIETILSSGISELSEDLILTCGYFQLKETMDVLRNISIDRTAPRHIRIAAYKALARMGDENALYFLISQVERSGMNDDVVAILLPDLIYTQQRPAFDLIIAALFDDTLRCTSSNPDHEVPISCAFRIMEMLAPLIKDFPLEVEASGDIRTRDYREALQILRRWFNTHRTDYVILTESF
jgi:hypothetical protein